MVLSSQEQTSHLDKTTNISPKRPHGQSNPDQVFAPESKSEELLWPLGSYSKACPGLALKLGSRILSSSLGFLATGAGAHNSELILGAGCSAGTTTSAPSHKQGPEMAGMLPGRSRISSGPTLVYPLLGGGKNAHIAR